MIASLVTRYLVLGFHRVLDHIQVFIYTLKYGFCGKTRSSTNQTRISLENRFKVEKLVSIQIKN